VLYLVRFIIYASSWRFILAKTLSPAAIIALKEALCSVYWYKKDLRTFLTHCLSNKAILAQINWADKDYHKREIASDIVDLLVNNQNQYLGDLTRICVQLCKMNDFNHLKRVDDSAKKIEVAKLSVQQLKKLVEPHQDLQKEKDDTAQRQELAKKKLQQNQAVREKLEQVKKQYLVLVRSPNPQGRGFELENLMYDLFNLFDLDPKASFKNIGEQIDGAFNLEGTDYLFEAKWQKEMVNKADLVIFSDKVKTKLENTLGVFLSINGFSEDGIKAHQAGGASIILENV
jgi:hypothetical protein